MADEINSGEIMTDEIVDLIIRSPEEIEEYLNAQLALLSPKLRAFWDSALVLDVYYPEEDRRDWSVEGTINGKRWGYMITQAVAQDRQAAEAALRRAAEVVERSNSAEPIFGESNV